MNISSHENISFEELKKSYQKLNHLLLALMSFFLFLRVSTVFINILPELIPPLEAGWILPVVGGLSILLDLFVGFILFRRIRRFERTGYIYALVVGFLISSKPLRGLAEMLFMKEASYPLWIVLIQGVLVFTLLSAIALSVYLLKKLWPGMKLFEMPK